MSASIAACLGAGATQVLAQSVYVTNAGSNTVTKISGGVKTTYSVGGMPQWIVASADGNHIYTANAKVNAPSVSKINTSTDVVTHTAHLGDGTYSLALTADGETLYAAHYTDGSISKINTSSMTGTTSETAGVTPLSLALSQDESLIYVSNFTPTTVTVLDTSSLVSTGVDSLQSHPYHLARTPDGSKILATSSFGYLTTFIPPSTSIQESFSIGGNSRAIAVTNGSNTAYVSSYDDDYIDLIDLSTGAKLAHISNVPNPNAMALSPDGSMLFVANYTTQGTLTVINTSTNSVLETIEVGTQASGVAVTSGPAWVLSPKTVPTLTEWAMILLGMVLAGFAALTIQRRRQMV